MLALSYGAVHSHAFGGGDAQAVAVNDGGAAHDHDHGDGGPDGTRVAGHCGYCTVLAGKFYLPAMDRQSMTARSDGLRWPHLDTRLTSSADDDFFRPPTSPDIDA